MRDLIVYAAAVVVVAQILVHILFAIGLNQTATEDQRRSADPLFVGVGVWTFATLLGGPFVAGLYWVMHHSTLRPRNDGFAQETPAR